MKDDSRVDNPDQRIQEDHTRNTVAPHIVGSKSFCQHLQDIGNYVASTYDLTFGLLDALIQLAIYSCVVWTLALLH